MNRENIADLAKQSPQYLQDAAKRARRLAKETKLECEFCENRTFFRILHVFPPTNQHVDDPLDAASWHVKCKKCKFDGYFSVQFEPDDPRGEALREEFKRIQRNGDNR